MVRSNYRRDIDKQPVHLELDQRAEALLPITEHEGEHGIVSLCYRRLIRGRPSGGLPLGAALGPVRREGGSACLSKLTSGP